MKIIKAKEEYVYSDNSDGNNLFDYYYCLILVYIYHYKKYFIILNRKRKREIYNNPNLHSEDQDDLEILEIV